MSDSIPAQDEQNTIEGNDLTQEHQEDVQPVMETTPKTPENYEPVEITLQTLLDAGAHYGHQASRWNPKMMPYIYGERNDVHILNLDMTLNLWRKAAKVLEDIANRGGMVLFVGTKLQGRDLVKQAAERCGAFSITQRWLGGTLSNFETVKRSINRMKKLEELLLQANDGESKVKINKKEKLNISRQLQRLEDNLGGIRNMRHLPDALFVIDINRESIAVSEARKLHIPVIALVDTNVDPTVIDYPIPSNDDATKTIRLFVNAAADAVQRGRQAFLARGPEREKREASEVTSSTKRGKSDTFEEKSSKTSVNGGSNEAAEESAPAVSAVN
ncbi:MAG: 30S ribosomal protein S2 [Bdellovibrionales bacterium]|nr:30S ribosomal protein S2 [Bdellovibrionales bacterium]